MIRIHLRIQIIMAFVRFFFIFSPYFFVTFTKSTRKLLQALFPTILPMILTICSKPFSKVQSNTLLFLCSQHLYFCRFIFDLASTSYLIVYDVLALSSISLSCISPFSPFSSSFLRKLKYIYLAGIKDTRSCLNWGCRWLECVLSFIFSSLYLCKLLILYLNSNFIQFNNYLAL